jgi:hypothetical protein
MSSAFDDILKQQANLEKLLGPTAEVRALLKDWNAWKQIEDAAAIARRVTDPLRNFPQQFLDVAKISMKVGAVERIHEEIERMDKLMALPVSESRRAMEASMGGSAALLRAMDEIDRTKAMTDPTGRLGELMQEIDSMHVALPLFDQLQPEPRPDYFAGIQKRIDANRAKAEAIQNANNEKLDAMNERLDQIEAENEQLKAQISKLVPGAETPTDENGTES